MESPLDQKLRKLEEEAEKLTEEKDKETYSESKNVIRAELTSLNIRIAELQKEKNILSEQNRGNVLFLRREF
jgi:hypothetical protein